MKINILVFALFLSVQSLTGQVAKDSELFITMKKQDSIFFDRCFNKCDFDYLEKAVDPEFMFYHDQGGIQNRELFFERTKTNICSDPLNKPIRKVVPESLEVFPMYNNGVLYGVIQNGEHEFYRKKPDQEEVLTGDAKFSHLYLLKNEKWILKQVYSFEHKSR